MNRPNIFEEAFEKKGKTIRPIFTVDYAIGGLYGGACCVLTIGENPMNWTRARILIAEGSTPASAAGVLREIADQLENGQGPDIRHGDELFQDCPTIYTATTTK